MDQLPVVRATQTDQLISRQVLMLVHAGGPRVEATRVTVPGVKRVWGTKKDASTTVVLQTIRQLTKIDPEKKTDREKEVKLL